MIYEIRYNADISDNTFIGNAVAGGPTLHGFPDAALQKVLITKNTFAFTPSAVSAACRQRAFCGSDWLFRYCGATPPYTGYVVPTNVPFHQNNHFTDTTYTGPWMFDASNQGASWRRRCGEAI